MLKPLITLIRTILLSALRYYNVSQNGSIKTTEITYAEMSVVIGYQSSSFVRYKILHRGKPVSGFTKSQT